MTLKPGDFEVVPMGGEGGRLIHIAQWLNGDGFANYEHARVYIGNDEIVEAMPGGARIAPVSEHDDGLWSSDIIDLDDIQRQMIVGAARKYVGVPYSVMDYFAIAAVRLHLGPFIPYLRSYVATSKHMICSQLVDKCYQNARVQLFTDGRWNGYVTPADLADLLLAKVGKVG